MKLTLLLSLLFISFFSFAQYSINGSVADQNDQALSFASVVILNEVDSSMVTFGLTDDKGIFKIDVSDTGNYLLQVSYLGYASVIQPIVTDWQQKGIEIPRLQLKESSTKLDAVDINADRIPIRMRGDTIEYDASAFKVSPGSDVEKLLEKIPGIEVDENGDIMAHGKKVEKILVDGKEFFGNDPKMATKNLDAAAIEKVEVLDKKSKDAEFTGVDDGNESKTLNLTLKEDFKTGSFGKVYGAVGTEDTYKGKINYNRFNEKTQVSLLGNVNNLNEQPFSYNEFREFNGNGGYNSQFINGDALYEGINDNRAAGVNLNHEFSKSLEVQAYYYLINNEKDVNSRNNTSNFTNDTTFKTSSISTTDKSSFSHSFNVQLDWDPDSLSTVEFFTNYSLSTEDLIRKNQTIYNPDNDFSSFTLQRSDEEKFNNALNSELSYKRKFKKEKRNISVGLEYNGKNQEEDLRLNNLIFNDTINQLQDYNYDVINPQLDLSYTEPLDSFWLSTVGYSYEYEENNPTRKFYDVANNENVFNNALSSDVKRISSENKASLSFKRIKKDKTTYSFGAAVSNVDLRTTGVNNDYQYVLPFASLGWKIKKTRNVDIRYYSSTTLPSLTQLVSITNNLNPNSTYVGNPNLKPEYRQGIRLNYFFFDPKNSSNVYLGINASNISKKIINQTIINSDFTRTITPQNTGFYQNIDFYAGTNRPFKKLKVKYSLYGYVDFRRYDVFLNQLETQVNETSYYGRVSVKRLKKEKWDLNVGFNASASDRRFEANSDFNQVTSRVGWFANFEYEFKNNFNLEVNYYSNFYNSAFNASAQSINNVSFELRKSIADDRWAIYLLGFDVLNENIGLNRYGGDNSLTESFFNTRAQIFMIGIERSLGKKKKKNQNIQEWF